MKLKGLSEDIILNELGLILSKMEDALQPPRTDKQKIEELCNIIKDHNSKLRNLLKNEKFNKF